MDEKCETCRFSLEVDSKQKYVRCRRFPPTLSKSEDVMNSDQVTHFGALVKKTWWCGEWRKKGK